MESILVLEDDENYRGILADTLGDQGYEVVEAAGAQEAIRLAEQRPFHLILSDVRMAGPIDGVGAIEQIKKRRPHIRSVVLTGYTDQDVPLRAAQVQADDYLFKPVQADQLLDVVRLTLDRESDTLGLLSQILQTPGDLAQKALSWLYDGKLQQLGQLRERCFQRLFVLLRSNRLSPEDAYPVYLQLLEVESKYHQSRPGDWTQLLTAYIAVESQILAAIAHETAPRSDKPALTWAKFQRLCKILKEGEVSAEQFQLSALLFLDSISRRANLANYLAYQKLWATVETGAPRAADPLLGKTFGGYTLHKLLPEYTAVRVYSALDDSKIGSLIMAFPSEANAQEIIQAEIQSGKATPLGRHHDFELLLLNRKDYSLRQQMPPGGLLPADTWKLIRPVFLQVQEYHEQEIYSGTITPEDIELIPGEAPRLTRFGPQVALGIIQQELAIKAKGLAHPARMMRGAPPEIASASVDKPIPASDQAMLAFVFSRILLGLETLFNPLVFLLVPLDGNVERHLVWKQIHSTCSRSVPEICTILRKMAHPDHTKRYPSLKEAISEIDQALKLEGGKE